jgi:hypothetical protein
MARRRSSPLPAAPVEGRLTPFEGEAVIAMGVEIPGAGGGLHDSMAVDPRENRRGDEMTVIVSGPIDRIKFVPVTDKGVFLGLRRVEIMLVKEAVIVDREQVATLLDAERERVLAAKEAVAGLARIPFGDEHQDAHDKGEHASGIVEGCPSCEAEAKAQAAGD